MTRAPHLLRILLLGLTVWALASVPTGCSKDNAPTAPGPGGGAFPYGKGSLSFDAAGAGGHFSASGGYTPSAQFAGDTASQGAGGFLHDTVSAGHPYKARLNAYTHRLTGGFLSERVIVMTLNNSAGALATGAYTIMLPDSAGAGLTAQVTLLFFSDSLAVYAAYEGTSGTVTISAIDPATREVQGTFTGTMRGTPPDTSQHVVLETGTFDLILANHYYDY